MVLGAGAIGTSLHPLRALCVFRALAVGLSAISVVTLDWSVKRTDYLSRAVIQIGTARAIGTLESRACGTYITVDLNLGTSF